MYGLKRVEIFVTVVLGKNYVLHESLIGSFGFSIVHCLKVTVLILKYFLGITAWRYLYRFSKRDMKAEGQISQVEKVVELCHKWMPGCKNDRNRWTAVHSSEQQPSLGTWSVESPFQLFWVLPPPENVLPLLQFGNDASLWWCKTSAHSWLWYPLWNAMAISYLLSFSASWRATSPSDNRYFSMALSSPSWVEWKLSCNRDTKVLFLHL